eukprot:6212058-Pleurochrysis_carterae.AAC.1
MPARCTSTPVSSTAPMREALASAFTFRVTLASTSTATESAARGAEASAFAQPATRAASTSPIHVIYATTGVAGELEVAAFSSRDTLASTPGH